ncbi:hypothetical protein [Microcoleus sp. BROC3]
MRTRQCRFPTANLSIARSHQLPDRIIRPIGSIARSHNSPDRINCPIG